MTTEPQANTPVLGIVVCGTCDTVFRAHERRQTCPACGGDAAFVIMDLNPTESPADDLPATSGEPAETAGDRPEDTPPAGDSASAAEPSVALPTAEDAGEPEGSAEGQAPPISSSVSPTTTNDPHEAGNAPTDP